MSTIRKAARADLDAVCRIYDQIHTAEERGEATIGWQRGVYPERETAEAAPARVRAGLVRAPQPRVREFQGQLSEPAL